MAKQPSRAPTPYVPRYRKVLDVLRGPIVARIRFRIPTPGDHHLEITQLMFQVVAKAVEEGRVTVRAPMGLPDDVTAQYSGAEDKRDFGIVVPANTIELRSLTGSEEASYAVHECLHAAFDLMHIKLDANSEEAAAYICTAVYCLLAGVRPNWVDDKILSKAGQIAQGIVTHYKKNGVRMPTINLSEWNELRRAVMFDPTYIHKKAGLKSLLGAQYPHDG